MKMRHRNLSDNQSTAVARVQLGGEGQPRILQSILGLKQPALLIALQNKLVLDLLAEGLQADICDHSLERLGLLARSCLELGLGADLYWQPLGSLDLPGRYPSIVLGPSAWTPVPDSGQARLVQHRLEEHLASPGEIKLLLN